MTEGYNRLAKAAAEFPSENVCPKCKNPDFERIFDERICPECKEQFFPEQTLVVNFFADALRIANEPGYDSARFEHVDVLVSHAAELHQKIAELEELLAIERKRLAGSQRVVDECAARMAVLAQ